MVRQYGDDRSQRHIMMASSPRAIVAPPDSPPDWWMLDIQMKIFEFIYHVVVTLGVDSALLTSSSLDTLLDDPKLDSAIQLVYRRLRLPGSRGDPPHRTASEWHHDKRKILECLVPIHQEQSPYEPAVDAAEIRPFNTPQASDNSYQLWVTLGITTGYTEQQQHQQHQQQHQQQQQRPLQPYHTPRTPGNLLDHDLASSETETASENTVTLGDSQAPFSPADSVSRGRRKRSTSSMQNEKPGKRTRGGPQDHVCPACGKKFPFLSKLKDHLKTHSTEKVLGCHLCSKRFKRSREVNAHLKSVHKIDIQTIEPSSAPSISSHSHSPLSMNPATPASLPTPHSLFPPTPGSSSSYQPPPPRPSPRSTLLLPLSGPYPTPGQFDESTPASTAGTDYRETPSAYTPHSYQSYDDDRMHGYREASYRGDGMEDNDGGGKSAARDSNSPEHLADRVERIDMNRDNLKLAPLWKLAPSSSFAAPTPQNTQPQQEPLPSIDEIQGLSPVPVPVPVPVPAPTPVPTEAETETETEVGAEVETLGNKPEFETSSRASPSESSKPPSDCGSDTESVTEAKLQKKAIQDHEAHALLGASY